MSKEYEVQKILDRAIREVIELTGAEECETLMGRCYEYTDNDGQKLDVTIEQCYDDELVRRH